MYQFTVTPTNLYMQDNESSIPIILSIVVAVIFALMAVLFLIYDRNVQRRNRKMMETAVRTGALVSSIFPTTVRERLLENGKSKQEKKKVLTDNNDDSTNHGSNRRDFNMSLSNMFLTSSSTTVDELKSFFKSDYKNGSTSEISRDTNRDDFGLLLSSKPIADLFTDTTILFADICGFTAWSSAREPTQVFTLLETIYRAFDV